MTGSGVFFRKIRIALAGGDRLLVPVNTWDHEVIAREGDLFSGELVGEVASLGRRHKLRMVKLEESFFAGDCGKFLHRDSDEYPFISKNTPVRKEVLKHVSSTSVPKEILAELRWIKTHYPYNYHHIVGVTVLMTQIAIDLQWEKDEIQFCSGIGILYDLGLGRVPGEIINKEDSLTRKERRIVNQHPYYSALLAAYYYQDGKCREVRAVLNHHETLNGRGWPRRVKNTDLICNLLRACDLFDALVSDRPFRGLYSNEHAMEICLKEIREKRILPDAFPLIFYYHLMTGKEPRK